MCVCAGGPRADAASGHVVFLRLDNFSNQVDGEAQRGLIGSTALVPHV